MYLWTYELLFKLENSQIFTYWNTWELFGNILVWFYVWPFAVIDVFVGFFIQCKSSYAVDGSNNGFVTDYNISGAVSCL